MHTNTKDRQLHRLKEMRYETLHCQNLIIWGSVWSKCMTETDDLQSIKNLNKLKHQ